MPQRSARSCGSCSQWCKHCRSDKKGCTIYETRPNVCKAFACGWLLNASIDDTWWPARSKIVIHYHRNGPKIICAFVVDASYPHRWREEPYFSGIREAALAGLSQRGAGRFITHVEIGPRKLLILPSREIDVSSNPHVVVQTSKQQWDVLCFKTPEEAHEVITKANAIIDRIATYPDDQRDTLLFELNRALAARFGKAGA